MPSPPRMLLCRGGSPPPRRGFVRSHLQVWAGWLLLVVLLLQVRVGHAQALPNLLENSSFEQTGAPNTNGAPAAVHAYNGTGTPFGTNVNALRWVGGVNGVSPFNTPIARMQVLAVGSQAKVSWVHSPKALDGPRYLLLEGTNSCVDLRAVSGGNWGSVLLPGRTYEFCLWADTAGNADSSFTLTLEAGLPLGDSVESLGVAGRGLDLGRGGWRILESEEPVDGRLNLGIGRDDVALLERSREADVHDLRVTGVE